MPQGQMHVSLVVFFPPSQHPVETVAKVNSLTILLARLSRLCRKDEVQGAEGEV